MLCNTDLPWAEIGINVSEAKTARQAITKAGLNWQVEQWPVLARSPKGKIVEISGKVCNVKTDTSEVLGIVSSDYLVVHNSEAFEFLDEFASTGYIKFVFAGTIFDNKKIWLLTKLSNDIVTSQKEVIQQYILLTNSHDGSRSLRMVPSVASVTNRSSFNLTISRDDKTEGIIVQQHYSGFKQVESAKDNLIATLNRLNLFRQEVEELIARTVSKEQIDEYYSNVLDAVGSKKFIRKAVIRLFNYLEDISKSNKYSWWQIFNSICQYTDNDFHSGRNRIIDSRHARLNSIWFGQSNKLKQKAFQLALRHISK